MKRLLKRGDGRKELEDNKEEEGVVPPTILVEVRRPIDQLYWKTKPWRLLEWEQP